MITLLPDLSEQLLVCSQFTVDLPRYAMLIRIGAQSRLGFSFRLQGYQVHQLMSGAPTIILNPHTI